MAKVLFLNPNRWGRGITNIWAPAHAGILRRHGHTVELFDATFYKDWSLNEIDYNTSNEMYLPSDYVQSVEFKLENIYEALDKKITEFKPDVIFAGGITSHIHGEGEYVLPQYASELTENIDADFPLILAGLQPTALGRKFLDIYPNITGCFVGESEIGLVELCCQIEKGTEILDAKVPGLYLRGVDAFESRSLNATLDDLGEYDYSIFDNQNFVRAYQGNLVRAVDFEISRGCIFTCDYCVETVIQKHYGFDDRTKRGALKNSSSYLRNKNAEVAFKEFMDLHLNHGINFFRMQDTNFLTIDKNLLMDLACLFDDSGLNKKIKLYIETRPEGINLKSISLLKRLGVCGVGMGVELASQSFREDELNRYAETTKVERAFGLLRENEILRTAYNIIGLPGSGEAEIKETIAFNAKIDPDNITVAYFSPYVGTGQATKASDLLMADPYEKHVDSALRPICRGEIDIERLKYYKKNFVRLVREQQGS